MSDDRLQINTLERALSVDVNDLQSMLTRQWAELLRFLGADRPVPSLYLPDDNDGTQSAPQPFCLGLEVTRVNATTVRVHPGALAKVSPTSITQGALDSTLRIARLLSAQDLTVPASAYATGGFFLLSARIVETAITNVSREVFVPASQTFVVLSLDKQVRTVLEFRFDDPGGAGQYFPFASLPSTDWEPLAYVKLYSSTGDAFHGQIIDARRDLRDVIKAHEFDPSTTDRSAPKILQRALESMSSPTNQSKGHFRGNFWATINGQRFGVERSVDGTPASVIQPPELLDAPSTNQLRHYYLCPVKSGGLSRVLSGEPTIVTGGVTPSRRRGVLVSTSVGPTRNGVNSDPLSLPGAYGSDAIEIGEAVHVFSASTSASSSSFLRPFTCSGQRQRYVQPPIVVTDNGSSQAIADTGTLDLRPWVPRNVKIVRLQLRLGMTGDTDAGIFVDVRLTKGGQQVGATHATMAATDGSQEVFSEFEVAIPTPLADDGTDTAEDAYLLLAYSVTGRTNAVPPLWSWDLRIAGWDYA